MKAHKSTDDYNILKENTVKPNAFLMVQAMACSYKVEDYKFCYPFYERISMLCK